MCIHKVGASNRVLLSGNHHAQYVLEDDTKTSKSFTFNLLPLVPFTERKRSRE